VQTGKDGRVLLRSCCNAPSPLELEKPVNNNNNIIESLEYTGNIGINKMLLTCFRAYEVRALAAITTWQLHVAMCTRVHIAPSSIASD
jgi:hypothetical protein